MTDAQDAVATIQAAITETQKFSRWAAALSKLQDTAQFLAGAANVVDELHATADQLRGQNADASTKLAATLADVEAASGKAAALIEQGRAEAAKLIEAAKARAAQLAESLHAVQTAAEATHGQLLQKVSDATKQRDALLIEHDSVRAQIDRLKADARALLGVK